MSKTKVVSAAGIGESLLHECEDGHTWTEQADGGVSPSWAMALTSVHYPGWDPRACPEPDRNADGTITCSGCGERYYICHGTPGVMCDPWNYDKRCQPAPPCCGKPPVKTFRWSPGDRRRGEPGGWLEITERQLDLFEEVVA